MVDGEADGTRQCLEREPVWRLECRHLQLVLYVPPEHVPLLDDPRPLRQGFVRARLDSARLPLGEPFQVR